MTTDLDDAPLHEPRLWRDQGWTAQIIKNEDDEGWAVAMFKAGESEPALVGPWTMGRDKKNPKPLDTAAFNTLVKTASEVIRRHEQQLHAQLNKTLYVAREGAWIKISLEIVPAEDDPYAWLRAHDAAGEPLAQHKVAAGFRLTQAAAEAWVDSGFERPAGRD
ncbi:MAG: hypothetical protein V3V71_18835 [Roseateles sp.]|nr:hypothetical protein [Methylibium sp.]MBY0367865.1 hypothetical protein [Burkholderiaceae bacterium]